MGERCGTVLIVEDSGPFRCALRDALRFRFPDLTILEAGGLVEGGRKVREGAPDVVFLDISLPDGNGLDLAEVVRRERPRAALAVCTSYDTPEYREGAFRRGATHFLSKEDLDWEVVGDIVEGEVGHRRKGSPRQDRRRFE